MRKTLGTSSRLRNGSIDALFLYNSFKSRQIVHNKSDNISIGSAKVGTIFEKFSKKCHPVKLSSWSGYEVHLFFTFLFFQLNGSKSKMSKDIVVFSVDGRYYSKKKPNHNITDIELKVSEIT